MEIENLHEWNSWWEDKDSIKNLIGKARPKYKLLLESLKIGEITIITGVRRSGKSTLMYQMINKLLNENVDPNQILFLNFEDNELLAYSLDDIYQTYRINLNPEKKAYFFIDEIHRKEGWESWIRKKYDLKTNDKFVISGSCSYLLKKEYSTLLTGRNISFEVFPLSFEEFLLFQNVSVKIENIKKGIILEKTKILIMRKLNNYLTLGGFPEILSKDDDFKIRLLKQYFDDILYKDVAMRYNLNLSKIRDFALFLMVNFTRLISLRNVRNTLGISYDTIKDYLSLFNEAFVFFTLDHFSYSFKEQKTRASKVYCIDNGLRNATAFKFSKDEGKLVENLVLIELKRRGKDIYYWKDKYEIDFILKNNNQSLVAMNVTYSNEINEREVKALLEFKDKYKNKIKKLLILTKDLSKEEKGIIYMPLWKWLLSEA